MQLSIDRIWRSVIGLILAAKSTDRVPLDSKKKCHEGLLTMGGMEYVEADVTTTTSKRKANKSKEKQRY